ncbi:hypothetical protein GCM10023340_19590 [Nocardioides marinquilinus]|uniref:Helix-turn-helix domain-containing protein n=1 Tax=Nocardioides marinquilinus TaxID=1210400 RepID=A0ABP9PIU3_9ACTN
MTTVDPLLIRIDRSQRACEDEPDSVARLLGISSKSAWRLLDRGELPRIKIGARTFTTRQSLDELIARGGAPSLKKPGEA